MRGNGAYFTLEGSKYIYAYINKGIRMPSSITNHHLLSSIIIINFYQLNLLFFGFFPFIGCWCFLALLLLLLPMLLLDLFPPPPPPPPTPPLWLLLCPCSLPGMMNSSTSCDENDILLFTRWGDDGDDEDRLLWSTFINRWSIQIER